MKEIMAFLAEQWIMGYSVITVLCIGLYLVYSIRTLKSCRKVGYDVGVSAMVPIWNLLLPIKKRLFIRKKKKLAMEEEIVL